MPGLAGNRHRRFMGSFQNGIKGVPLVLAFAVAGWFALQHSHAATFVAAKEAESGSLSGNQAAGDATGASGGASVKFGTGNSSSGAKPDASNTGVPDGTQLATVTGNQTFGSSYNGQTISGKDFHGYVLVTGSNITFKNCIFRGGTPNGNNALLDTQSSGASGIVVQDSEFAPTTPAATIDDIYAANLTLLRVDVHGGVDGIKASDNTTIQDSFIHDLSYFASDPNQGGGPTHNDTIQILDGNNIVVRHNNLTANITDANSAIQITQDFGLVGAVLLDKNWADYGGCTFNIAHKGGSSLTGISVTNNRFGRHQGFNGCTVIISTQTTLAAYSGNVWDDTGQAVPPPQQHD
jgi:hypothetical protein